MYYVYTLISLKDNQLYVGYTGNLKERLKNHSAGLVDSTRHRRPLRLIYYEACLNQRDALKREKYLKTTWGKRYLRNRISAYLQGENLNSTG